MPSKFPGVDPFIEGQRWPNFHGSIIFTIRDMLVPSLRPRYVVDVEQYVYLALEEYDDPRLIRPDVFIADAEPSQPRSGGGTATAVLAEPATVRLPFQEVERHRYLTIRKRDTHKLITVIEVLSPANKQPGSDDYRTYLNKREDVLRGGANLVELDLLRGGKRMPTADPLPPADYYALVCRTYEQPRADAYHWTLREPLPVIPIPLAQADPDVTLDLQMAFTTVYDHAGYDYSLDYGAGVDPSLSENDRAWVQEILRSLNT